jgi:hypothetical protein
MGSLFQYCLGRVEPPPGSVRLFNVALLGLVTAPPPPLWSDALPKQTACGWLGPALPGAADLSVCLSYGAGADALRACGSVCACMQTQHKVQLDARDAHPELVRPPVNPYTVSVHYLR